jgi:hypothetical protein
MLAYQPPSAIEAPSDPLSSGTVLGCSSVAKPTVRAGNPNRVRIYPSRRANDPCFSSQVRSMRGRRSVRPHLLSRHPIEWMLPKPPSDTDSITTRRECSKRGQVAGHPAGPLLFGLSIFCTDILNRRAGVMWSSFAASAIADLSPALQPCQGAWPSRRGSRRASGPSVTPRLAGLASRSAFLAVPFQFGPTSPRLPAHLLRLAASW